MGVARVRSGLPRLNIGSDAREPDRPKTTAYALYMRVNVERRRALAAGDHAAGARGPDPNYAPAWSLAHRYYYDGQYSDGGMAAIAEEGHRRAIDRSDLVSSRRGLIVHQTEWRLFTAYLQARDLAL